MLADIFWNSLRDARVPTSPSATTLSAKTWLWSLFLFSFLSFPPPPPPIYQFSAGPAISRFSAGLTRGLSPIFRKIKKSSRWRRFCLRRHRDDSFILIHPKLGVRISRSPAPPAAGYLTDRSQNQKITAVVALLFAPPPR